MSVALQEVKMIEVIMLNPESTNCFLILSHRIYTLMLLPSLVKEKEESLYSVPVPYVSLTVFCL